MSEFAKHLRAVVLLPGTAVVFVPAWCWWRFGVDPLGVWRDATAAAVGLASVGAACALAGLALVVATVRMLAVVGRGTVAPWDPTRKLVVRGVYRHVRNPMISGVLAVVLGEALLTASPAVLAWFGVFALANALYIPLCEERLLRSRFGDEYAEYAAAVPRWLPRRTAWEPARRPA